MEDSIINNLLRECLSVRKPDKDESKPLFDEITTNSQSFPINFPIETVRCHSLVARYPKDVLEENAISTYPLIHEKVLKLMCLFIKQKRSYGTEKEKTLYATMSLVRLVDRLLKKRAVMFVGRRDRYILTSKAEGTSGWETIGTAEEKSPLVLEDCITYDEIKLSAMLYISGRTIFINDGSRYNEGKVENDVNKIEDIGIITGLIGTRFERPNFMEYQDIIITKEQNVRRNGYGRNYADSLIFDENGAFKKILWRNLWSHFYELPSLEFDEASDLHKQQSSNIAKKEYSERFYRNADIIFDNAAYKKRLSIPFDCILLEASERGKNSKMMAYLHMVGIGLSVWKVFNQQTQVYVLTLLERIKALCPRLTGLSDVHVSYISGIDEEVLTNEGQFIKCDSHPQGGIRIHMSNREPTSKLTEVHKNKLLVESYAWDGNAQPGNEFWYGSLSASGDPAAASSSQVSELHNSHINNRFVSGQNLHVAGKHGILHVSQYARRLLEE